MTRRLFTALALALIVTGVTISAHEHKVAGTVTMAAADHVMMTTPEGKAVTVKVIGTTKITKGKESVKIDTVKAGLRIVVTTESDEDPYTAKVIQVAETPAPKE